MFKLLSSYHPELLLEWNYNDTHHGKGLTDSICRTAKNIVLRQVKSNKIVINSPTEFYDAENKFALLIK